MTDDKNRPAISRADIERLLRQAFPDPHNSPTVPEDYAKRLEHTLFGGEDQVIHFPPHMRRFLKAISEDDVRRMETLLSLSPKTVAWISDKNERELNNLDGAVEFISSSRTAARVLMWVGGMAVAFVGGVTALAKNGIDLFALLRGGR